MACASCATTPRYEAPVIADAVLAAAENAEGTHTFVLRHTKELVLRPGPPNRSASVEIVEEFSAVAVASEATELRYARHAHAPWNTRVTSVDAIVQPADGSAPRRFSLADASDLPVRSMGTFVSDTRMIAVDLGRIARGDRVDWRVRSVQREPELMRSAVYFASEAPVAERSLEVHIPAGWRMQWHAERDGAAWPPEEESTPTGTRWRWRIEDARVAKSHALAAPVWLRGPWASVHLVEWRDTSGVAHRGLENDEEAAAWVHRLSPYPTRVHDLVRAQALQILAGMEGAPTRERAATLYGWVRDHVTYCSVQIGLGG